MFPLAPDRLDEQHLASSGSYLELCYQTIIPNGSTVVGRDG
jgi:hypothetical protein